MAWANPSISSSSRKIEQASEDFRFAAAVAQLGMLLRESQHAGDSSYDEAARLAGSARGNDREGYRGELLRMIDVARSLTPASRQGRAVTD